jgi:putative membrane protein
MKFLVRMVVSAVTFLGIGYFSAGALLDIEPDAYLGALLAALVLAIANAVIKPIVKFVSLPLRIVTLGLFGLVINAAMFYIVAWIVPDLELVGFWQTVVAALIMSVVMAVTARALDKDD